MIGVSRARAIATQVFNVLEAENINAPPDILRIFAILLDEVALWEEESHYEKVSAKLKDENYGLS